MAKNNEYDAIERARNAAKQLRDKNGRFATMNGKIRYKSNGKTKSATIVGISGGFVYAIPPLENPTHRPMPFRIPASSMEMTSPKATLKDKKTREHEKQYIAEQTKLFESKLDPNRKKEQDTHNRLVAEAKKNKSDVDTYEVDDDGVEHLKKNPPIEADPKVQAQVDAVLKTIGDGDKFEIPLQDGFKMEISRNNGFITERVLDSNGNEHSSRSFSDKKSDKEVSQELAKDIAKELDTPDVGEETEIQLDPTDIDGDGIPDISDPFIRPKWQTTTKASAPSKEDLDAAPTGTTLISEDGKVIYTKTARRSPSQGAQWSRYENTEGGSHKLLDEKVYSKDIADGTPYKRPSEAISEESVELTPEEKKAREKQAQEREARQNQKNKLNDKKKFVEDKKKLGGFSLVDDKLSNALPLSAERNPKVLDFITVPKNDLTMENLNDLPVGTQLALVKRNGKIARATKMSDTEWYTKQAFNDHLPKDQDQKTLTTEEVFENLGEETQIRASGTSQRTKDYNEMYTHRDKYRKKLNGESDDPIAQDQSKEELYKEIEDSNSVSGAEASAQLVKENTISDSDPVGTQYESTDASDAFVYTKMENGTIVNAADPTDMFDNAEGFKEIFPQSDEGANLIYIVDRGDTVSEPEVDSNAPVPVSVDVRALPKPVSKNPNKVRRGTSQAKILGPNPIETVTDINGEEHDLGNSKSSKRAVIKALYERGLIDPDTFDPKVLYEAEEGSEIGRFYDDGTPIRIGDEVLYNTSLREGAWNNKEHIWVRSVVTGYTDGKSDALLFPLETVYGKKKGTVRDEDGKVVARPVVETSFGPKDMLANVNGSRSANLNTIRRTTDEGIEQQGVNDEANIDGRTSTFRLDDLYTQDAKRINVGDRAKFRVQSRKYNKDGVPYGDVIEGEVIGFNTNNQSVKIRLDNGVEIQPSIKNMTTGDGPDPLKPSEVSNNLELPEGFRLDSQNRILSEESALDTEDARDSIGSNVDEGVNQNFPESTPDNIVESEIQNNFDGAEAEETGPQETTQAPETSEPSEATDVGGTNPEAPKKAPVRRKKRNLIDSVVNTDQEYDSSIPRYFRDRKAMSYETVQAMANDWSNAPVGSTIRQVGGGFAIKTSADTWDFRKSSKHLVQRNLSNKNFAKTLEANQDFLDNARTTAPTRKKFLEYNGGKLSPTARPSTRKAPVGSEVEVEGDKLTKTDSGWQGGQGVILSDKQLEKIMTENPEDTKVTKVPVSKVVSNTKSVAIQDSIFELNEDGSFSRNDVFSSSPKETISAEEVDSVAGEMSPNFNMVIKDRNNNSEDSWDAVETVSLDSDGNIVLTLDDSSEQTAKKVMADFASRLESEAVPPRRVILDDSEHFQTVSAYSKPNMDGGYDLVVNPDGAEESHIASAIADGIRQNNATVQGMSLRDYDTKVLQSLVSEEDRSLSYDEILKKLGVRSNRKGSVVAEAFEDVWSNGPDASPVHLNIWKRYASDSEMIALFRKENGRDPKSDSELDNYRKKL